MSAPITAIYAALLALFLVILIFPIIKLRRGLRIGLGDGGQSSLLQAVRAHGNAAEMIPIFVLLLLIYELNHAPTMVLHIFGSVFLLVRLAHAAGLYISAGASIWRVIGTLGSLTAIIGLAIANIVQVLK